MTMLNVLSLLVDQGTLERKDVAALEKEAGGSSGAALEAVLERRGVTPERVLKARGEYYQLPVRPLEEGTVAFDILRYVPEESARHYRLAPLRIVDGALQGRGTHPQHI